MAASSATLHEDPARLGPDTLDRHRAALSITEEQETMDDPELQAILTYSHDEKQAHAAMLLEWLRRHDGAVDDHRKDSCIRTAPLPHDTPAEQRGRK